MTVEQLKNVGSDVPTPQLPAVTATFTAPCVPNRRKDKQVAEEVEANKKVSRGVVKVDKELFPHDPEVKSMKEYYGHARNNIFYAKSVATSDVKGSPRVILIKNLEFVTKEMSKYEQKFNDARDKFLSNYEDRVARQAIDLGDMFDSSVYPTKREMRTKCYWRFEVMPLPQGDIGGVVGEMVKSMSKDMQNQYAYLLSEVESRNRLMTSVQDSIQQSINKEIYEGKNGLKSYLKNILVRIDSFNSTQEAKDRGEKVTNTKISESLLQNPLDKIEKLQEFNSTVNGDSRVNELCGKVQDAIGGVSTSQIKDSIVTRDSITNKVSDILEKL